MDNHGAAGLRGPLCADEAGLVHARQVCTESRHGNHIGGDVCSRQREGGSEEYHTTRSQVQHRSISSAAGSYIPTRCVFTSLHHAVQELRVLRIPASVGVLLPLFPVSPVLHTRVPLTIVLALCIAPLCLPKSLASTSILYTTWISIATFVAWIICMAYAHAKNIRTTNPTSESLGILWNGISEQSISTVGLQSLIVK